MDLESQIQVLDHVIINHLQIKCALLYFIFYFIAYNYLYAMKS